MLAGGAMTTDLVLFTIAVCCVIAIYATLED